MFFLLILTSGLIAGITMTISLKPFRQLHYSCALSLIAVNIAAAPQQCIAATTGKQIFDQSCSFCHSGGKNALPFAASKTLDITALKLNGYDSPEKIAKLIHKGAGAMPAFDEYTTSQGEIRPARLNPLEVDTVATYVFDIAVSNSW